MPGLRSRVDRAAPFNLKHHCTACGVIFKREEGFFVGAIMANVVATEVVILLTYFACLLLDLDDRVMLTILFAIGIAFPIAFYHHSWSLWLAMDHLIEGLPLGNLMVRKGGLPPPDR